MQGVGSREWGGAADSGGPQERRLRPGLQQPLWVYTLWHSHTLYCVRDLSSTLYLLQRQDCDWLF